MTIRWERGRMMPDTLLDLLDRPLGRWLEASARSQALLEAIRQIAMERLREVDRLRASGQHRFAYTRYGGDNFNVADIWRDLRIDALAGLWIFGSKTFHPPEPNLLASEDEQLNMLSFLSSYNTEEPCRYVARDKYLATTLAIGLVYDLLERARRYIGIPGGSAEFEFGEFMRNASVLGEQWRGFEKAKAALLAEEQDEWPEMPPFLVQVLFDDVTAKAKPIALAAVWTENWESSYKLYEAEFREELVEESLPTSEIEKNISRVQEAWQRLIQARDPDKLSPLDDPLEVERQLRN